MSSPTSINRRAKIILYGDSITQMSFSAIDCGWGAYIADRYQRRVDVLNRGMYKYYEVHIKLCVYDILLCTCEICSMLCYNMI